MNPVAPPTGDPRPDLDSVGAVVVTFHPDVGLYDRVLALRSQVTATLIVDNGSTEEELAPVHRLVDERIAELILNGRNLGQATALNQGMAWGESRGLSWIATLDQDTMPGPDLVAAAGTVFDRRRVRPLAVIGAGWIIPPRTRPDCSDPSGTDVVWAVTSGALQSVRVWRDIGQFRDDFFIDYVDIEYCLRARSRGYQITRVCRPTMAHAYGNPTRKRLLNRTVQPSNHSPSRRYYNTRNRLRVWRAYLRREARYVFSDATAWTRELVKLFLFEDGRPAKVRAILRGLRDAVRHSSGSG